MSPAYDPGTVSASSLYAKAAPAEEDTGAASQGGAEARRQKTIVQAPLVGLCGLAQSGKDTFAGYLGYRRIAFADPLKELALACNPLVWTDDDWSTHTLRWIVETYGWEAAKQMRCAYGKDVRQLLQDLGVGVRDILGPDTWVDAAFRTYDPAVATVITDCRFPNEFERIRSLGGVIVRIERHGQGSPDQHVSEQAWKAIEPDHWFTFADGAFADMQGQAERLDAWLRSER